MLVYWSVNEHTLDLPPTLDASGKWIFTRQFFVIFLGWLSDPFKRCWWPPTKESKGHFQSSGLGCVSGNLIDLGLEESKFLVVWVAFFDASTLSNRESYRDLVGILQKNPSKPGFHGMPWFSVRLQALGKKNTSSSMADTPAASPKVEKNTLPKMRRLEGNIYLP